MLFRIAALLLGASPLAASQQDPRAVALVITGGTLRTMDVGRMRAPDAAAIDDRAIVAVDTPGAIAALLAPQETIDSTGDVVMPDGAARVPALRAAGPAVGIGTDGAASNNDLDTVGMEHEIGSLVPGKRVLTLNEAAVRQEARALAAQVRAAVGR